MPDLEARTAQALRAIVWNHVAGKRLSLESASTVCICLLGDCGLQLRQAGYDIRGYPQHCAVWLRHILRERLDPPVWRPWPAALWEPTPAPAEGHDWELFRALGTHLHDVGAEAGLQLDAAIRVALALTADLLAMLRQMLDWELTDLDEMIDDTVQSGIRLYIANATPEPHINHHGGGRP